MWGTLWDLRPTLSPTAYQRTSIYSCFWIWFLSLGTKRFLTNILHHKVKRSKSLKLFLHNTQMNRFLKLFFKEHSTNIYQALCLQTLYCITDESGERQTLPYNKSSNMAEHGRNPGNPNVKRMPSDKGLWPSGPCFFIQKMPGSVYVLNYQQTYIVWFRIQQHFQNFFFNVENLNVF